MRSLTHVSTCAHREVNLRHGNLIFSMRQNADQRSRICSHARPSALISTATLPQPQLYSHISTGGQQHLHSHVSTATASQSQLHRHIKALQIHTHSPHSHTSTATSPQLHNHSSTATSLQLHLHIHISTSTVSQIWNQSCTA